MRVDPDKAESASKPHANGDGHGNGNGNGLRGSKKQDLDAEVSPETLDFLNENDRKIWDEPRVSLEQVKKRLKRASA